MKWVVLLTAGIAMVGVLAWSWLTDARAGNRALAAFTDAQNDVTDGCGFNCKGCGVKGTERVLGGRQVTLVYACGLLPADDPQYYRTGTVFVSAIGTVHGLPKR